MWATHVVQHQTQFMLGSLLMRIFCTVALFLEVQTTKRGLDRKENLKLRARERCRVTTESSASPMLLCPEHLES